MLALRRQRSILPGFGLSLGYAVTYLSLVILVPLSVLFAKSATLGWGRFWETVTSERVMGAYWMSFAGSLLAAAINVPLGFLAAWVLVRYSFPGKRLLDAIIDLPFAIPTAVAGIALATLYSEHSWLGKVLAHAGFAYPWPVWEGGKFPLTIQWFHVVARAPLGVILALLFVGLPFVVRTIQPVLQDMNPEVEEAAASLGARRSQTFWKVVLPQLRPAVLTGFALAFARGLGEYGSVVFITGGRPEADIAPRQIAIRIDQYEYAGATAIAVVLLVVSFVLLLLINLLQRSSAARGER